MDTSFYLETGVAPFTDSRRRGPVDRRRTPRGGRRRGDALRTAVLATFCAMIYPQMATAQPQPPSGQQEQPSPQHTIRFGFDAGSLGKARELGMPVGYASTWVGSWIQKYGWGGIESDLRAAKAAGVTPLVQWWYWGDDISPNCVENGCMDKYQGVRKDKATWYRTSNELADLIVRVLGPDSGALVIVETEFNKHGIETYEPFDGYLAEHAAILHARGLKVVVGFGNWGQVHWKNFDRAVGAADLLGAMVLQSSIHEATDYLSGADMLLNAARYNQATFGKPTLISDFAFSSYPEPSYERFQDTVVRDIFARIEEFREADVQGMVWRTLLDDPNFDTANYHGMAERHWGLIRADGSRKMAFEPFLNGMRAEADRTPQVPAAPTGIRLQ